MHTQCWVIYRRRALWPAATGAPLKPAAAAGGHGFGLAPHGIEAPGIGATSARPKNRLDFG
jgi:hypothetical protein